VIGKHRRGELPPVTVSCTANECGHQFLSRAARHAVVRCPRCGRGIRVKRPRPPGWQRKPAASAPRARPAPEPVCEKTGTLGKPSGLTPRPAPPSPEPNEDQGDDDGLAYMLNEDGRYVLADLTPDGRLVPVQLVDQQFRTIAPGFCSVYGCISPARHVVNGWPVCAQCRRDLAEATALHQDRATHSQHTYSRARF
jgi:DNA-directed RNA polymerase subunit RPC12/RpoP